MVRLMTAPTFMGLTLGISLLYLSNVEPERDALKERRQLGVFECDYDTSGYDICLSMDDFPSDVIPAITRAFEKGKKKWESVITGHLTSYYSANFNKEYFCRTYPSILDDLYMCGKGLNIDGPGKVLGYASASYVRTKDGLPIGLPITGYFRIDNEDISTFGPDLDDIVTHEMGHILGISEYFFSGNRLVESGLYIGQHAVREWHNYGCEGTPPIEHSGGTGTAGSHWDQEALQDELMTGYLTCRTDGCPLSKTTVGALHDLGYQVNYTAADDYTPNCITTTRRLNGDGRARLLRSSDGTHRMLSREGFAKAKESGMGFLKEANAVKRASEKGKGKGIGKGKGKGIGKGVEGISFVADQYVNVIYEEGGNIYGVDVAESDIESDQ